jgi:hypothetical protein
MKRMPVGIPLAALQLMGGCVVRHQDGGVIRIVVWTPRVRRPERHDRYEKRHGDGSTAKAAPPQHGFRDSIRRPSPRVTIPAAGR